MGVGGGGGGGVGAVGMGMAGNLPHFWLPWATVVNADLTKFVFPLLFVVEPIKMKQLPNKL